LLLSWIDRYPILSIEDPFAEDDPEGFRRFTKAVGGKVQVVGDDFLVTDAARVSKAAQDRLVNCVLVKPNQAGTMTEALAAFDAAQREGLSTIVSARSGETEDTTIAHLAVGWNAGQVKVGSITRGERTAKWNELIRLEEKLGGQAKFAGWSALPVSSIQASTRRNVA
jgi:enolase